MKLPHGQTINSSIPTSKPSPGALSPEKSRTHPIADSSSTSSKARTVNANTLQQLSSTWGKVVSSQPLSPEQVQRIAIQVESKGPALPTNELKLGDQIKQLEGQVKEGSKQQADLTLFLVKLDTQKGLLSLLSQTQYPKGNSLLIQQNSQGTWQLQRPSQGFSLSNLTAQFSGSILAPPAINLAGSSGANLSRPDQGLLSQVQTGQAQSPASVSVPATVQNQAVNTLKPPSSAIQSGLTVTAQAAEIAISNSGQSLESNLLKLAKVAVNSMGLNLPKIDEQSAPPNFKGRFKQVEQQLNQWVKQLTGEIPSLKDTTAKQALTNKQTALSKVAMTQIETSTANIKTSSPSGTQDNVNALINNDNKSWLIKNQHNLLSEFSKNLVNNNSFIPNWGTTGQFKNAGELSELFSIILAPKLHPAEGGKSIWPNNLSAQSQLQQTLQTLITHTPEAEKDTAQSQLLRQILNLSQGLMKVQHDQIHNRLGQQLDVSSPVQMSLPYLHQNQIQWAELEYKQTQHENEIKEKTTGWHLILRFSQGTPQSFSIETHLKQNQVAVVLWAAEKAQLKDLNQDISLLKEKLNHAGFNIDSIISKHGSPVKITKPIQQSLVDVHT